MKLRRESFKKLTTVIAQFLTPQRTPTRYQAGSIKCDSSDVQDVCAGSDRARQGCAERY